MSSSVGKRKPKAVEPTARAVALDRLITMANQIGDFFAPYPPLRRAEGIRNHLRTYWDPRMREDLLDYIDRGGHGLNAHVIEGARLLLEGPDRKGYYGPPQADHR